MDIKKCVSCKILYSSPIYVPDYFIDVNLVAGSFICHGQKSSDNFVISYLQACIKYGLSELDGASLQGKTNNQHFLIFDLFIILFQIDFTLLICSQVNYWNLLFLHVLAVISDSNFPRTGMTFTWSVSPSDKEQ